MGVLDEAIRDHLDLRRRHGASDAEIARAEAEALGPARRDPAAGLFSDEEMGSGDDQTTILDPVVEEEVGRAVEDNYPAAAESEVDGEGATAVYDLDHEFEERARREAPIEDMRVEDQPPIDSPPVEDEPPIEEAPVEEPPAVEEEPPVEGEPPLESEPRGHHPPSDDQRDESESPDPAPGFPRPYSEP